MPWDVLFLLGGGFALSKACKDTRLSEAIAALIAGALGDVGDSPTALYAISLVLCVLTASVTEFTSNTATANILSPILMDLSRKLCINPVYLGLQTILGRKEFEGRG